MAATYPPGPPPRTAISYTSKKDYHTLTIASSPWSKLEDVNFLVSLELHNPILADLMVEIIFGVYFTVLNCKQIN